MALFRGQVLENGEPLQGVVVETVDWGKGTPVQTFTREHGVFDASYRQELPFTVRVFVYNRWKDYIFEDEPVVIDIASSDEDAYRKVGLDGD